MKLSNTVFDLAEYIQPYPQIEKIDPDSIHREFKIAHEMFSEPKPHDEHNVSMEVTRTISYIREARSNSRSWVFRTFDQPYSVQKFYANKMHRPKWSIISQTTNSIQMRSGKMIMKVIFPRNPNGTLLIYTLNQCF